MASPPIERLWEALRDDVADERLDPATEPKRIAELATQVVVRYGQEAAVGAVRPLSDPAGMVQRLVRLVCEYGPLTEALASPATEEVLIEDDRVLVVGEGRLRGLLEPTTAAINRHVVDKLLAETPVRLDPTTPLIQAQVLDGRARLTAAGPPVIGPSGVSASLRLYKRRRVVLDDIVGWGTITPALADFARLLMEALCSVVISGAPAAGKTTLFSALLSGIRENRCVRVVEEYPELYLPTPYGRCYHCRSADSDGRGAVSLRDLVKFVLGMRADFIAVGEVRSDESWELTRAMNAGTGCGVTVHANSAEDGLEALVSTALGAGANVNEHHVRTTLAKGVDVVVHVERDDPNQVAEGDAYRRQVTEVRALMPQIERGEQKFSTVLLFERAGGLGSPLVWTGLLPPTSLVDRLEQLLPQGRMLKHVLAGEGLR